LTDKFDQPVLGDSLQPAQPSAVAVDFLRLRRSTPIDLMGGPGADADTLKAILTIAARAPDHRRLVPFRFVIFEGEARSRFGEVLVDAFQKAEPDSDETQLECERNRFLRAPVVVAVISSVNPEHKTPVWEQELTAGAVCQNLLHGASAFGFAAVWLSEWCAFDANVAAALKLEQNERIAGFIYLGTAKEEPKERPRPMMDGIISVF